MAEKLTALLEHKRRMDAVYVCIHICTYIYIYIHIHTHTHTVAQALVEALTAEKLTALLEQKHRMDAVVAGCERGITLAEDVLAGDDWTLMTRREQVASDLGHVVYMCMFVSIHMGMCEYVYIRTYLHRNMFIYMCPEQVASDLGHAEYVCIFVYIHVGMCEYV